MMFRSALSLAVLLLTLTAVAGADTEPRRVLMVHSFGSSAPPFTTHSTAFETTLTKELGRHVDLDEVSLDMARYAQPDMEDVFADFLLKRLSKWQPDLVVPIGSPAGRFVVKFRDRLFPGTPVIYTGMDRRTLPVDAFARNATFVGEDFDLAGLVEDILQIAPDTKNIEVILGATPLERYWTVAFRRAFEGFTDRITFNFLNDLSFDQMLDRLSRLPPHSFILLGLLLRDASGVTHNEDEALQRLRAVANAPINGLYQNQLGLGIVGGRLYQGELQGQESARIAIRILNGEPVSSFPPRIIRTQPPRYDWRELQRWGISEARLPPGSTVEFRQPTAWQRYRWWIVGTLAVALAQGGLIVQLALNLAKRRRGERALRESESRFRTVADSAPVLIWVSDVDKQCTFFNKPWLDFTGRTLEQELGHGWADGVHPDDREACLKDYGEAFEARRPFGRQYRLRRHDGEYRWMLDSGVPRHDAHGVFAGYIGSCSDITDRLHAEERFRQIFEAAPNAMIMVDAPGRIVMVNTQVEKVFGYTREELFRLPVEVLIPQGFRLPHSGHGRRSGAVPEMSVVSSGGTLAGRRRDGSELQVEISLNPIRTVEGLFVVVSVVDITERRRAEAEAVELRRELAHISRVATMGELTAAIVHEISQPLTAILSNAQAGLRVAGAAAPDLAEVGEIFKDIVEADQRADTVIRNLRSLFNKGEAEHRTLRLDALVREVVALVASDAQLRNVSIRLDLASDAPPVIGDRVQLQQVLLNLLVNAFDAMADVTGRPREVTVVARPLDGSTVQIDVADTGPGIAPDTLEALFEPFVTTKRGGMGMGLAVSRSIVRAHSGRLWVDNNPADGATFHIVLPTAPPTSGPEPAPV